MGNPSVGFVLMSVFSKNMIFFQRKKTAELDVHVKQKWLEEENNDCTLIELFNLFHNSTFQQPVTKSLDLQNVHLI